MAQANQLPGSRHLEIPLPASVKRSETVLTAFEASLKREQFTSERFFSNKTTPPLILMA